MTRVSVRKLDQLRSVLMDPQATGPDPVYQVVHNVGNDWENKTIINPGKIGQEYTKTHGHYHPDNAPDEIFRVAEGEGVLALQKKHVENGVIVPEMVEEVFLVKAKAGDEIKIKKDYGHSWSNIGNEPLVLLDDWKTPHSPEDYKPIDIQHGMAYFLVEEDGKLKTVPNPTYKDLPEPIWLTTEEVTSFAQVNQ